MGTPYVETDYVTSRMYVNENETQNLRRTQINEYSREVSHSNKVNIVSTKRRVSDVRKDPRGLEDSKKIFNNVYNSKREKRHFKILEIV